MVKKTSLSRRLKFQVRFLAKKAGLFHTLRGISREKYAEKISASLFYALLSSIAVNFFYHPGRVYAGGVTGLAQVLAALARQVFGLALPISVIFYALNVPLLILAWRRIGHRFTVFTFITVTLASLFIQFVPHIVLTEDPIINAIFGGLFMGTGIGYGLRSNISSGGTDIISLYLRKKTGREVGQISLVLNGLIMVFAGLLFGWQYALYSMIALFVSSRVTDGLYTKQKKMQATIVTNQPDKVIKMIHTKLHRGVTLINDAKGTYKGDKKAVLIAIITRAEYNEFKERMQKTDPEAFVAIAENVKIIGRFVDFD